MNKVCLPISLLLMGVLCSSCSFIGRQFDDHSLDYLTFEPQAEMPQDELIEAPYSQAYPIENTQDFAKPSSFQLARPKPLNLNEAQRNRYISLNAYQQQSANARLDYDGAGTLILKMDSAFDASWSEVLKVLEDSRFKLVDVNRSTGVYYLEYPQKADRSNSSWWRRLFYSDSMVMQTFFLKMDSVSSGVFLSLLTDGDTLAKPEVTQILLTEIRDKLTL